MKQYQAGYILDNLLDLFDKKTEKRNQVEVLAHWLSHFDMVSRSNFENSEPQYSPQLAVIINIIQRGLPSRLNLFALESIVKNSSLLSFDNNDSAIFLKWNDSPNEVRDLIFKCLHVIDPRLNRTNLRRQFIHSWENLDSRYEEDFILSDLPDSLSAHGDFIIQLLAAQRSINSIIKNDPVKKKIPEVLRLNFEQQRTDFSIEFPYHSKGVVVEIDGPQHDEPRQMYLDTERDRAVASIGWYNTLRIKTSEFSTQSFTNKCQNIFRQAIGNNYVVQLFNNYKTPIWNSPLGFELLNLALIPFAIARFQRILLEALAHNRLSLSADQWNIAVIERDVPFARLAIDDLLALIENLNALSNDSISFPKINLEIFSSFEFIESPFQSEDAKFIDDFNAETKYDLVFDLAVLERSSFISNIASAANDIITVRSSHFCDASRIIKTTSLITYNPFCSKTVEEKWIIDITSQQHLEYFLKSIFRKLLFRPGQLPILHNALQCKSVIGLLPTGGGKSLTYQLSALLQPGICLVIDPIRSLMKDQVDGLHRNLIDSCIFINSTLQGEHKREAMRKVSDGQSQFVFVSPERLQIEEFRILLEDLHENHLYFSYCVIDEAHCVSEWGHDFRTAYLRLGENAMRCCKTANLPHLPLFGLTATASYDVLADVQRELSGNDESRRLNEDAVIRSEFTKRPELQYMIEEVTFSTNGIRNIWDLKNALGLRKQQRIREMLTLIPNTIFEFSSNPYSVFPQEKFDSNEDGEVEAFEKMRMDDYDPDFFYNDNKTALIFCPHTKGIFGVTDRFKITPEGAPVIRQGYYDTLSSENMIKAGFFMGSSNDSDFINKQIQEDTFKNQDLFINNEINLMVATKAFGMGIDKENIRYTVHVNYPGSIESFVQESGRAGRDGKMAISYILFNDQEVDISGETINNDLETNMYFHRNSFKGVAKELAILDELLTEIHFPDRTFEIENLIANQLDYNVKCNYWEGGTNKWLYIDLGYNEPLGHIDLNDLSGNDHGSVNLSLSHEIFSIVAEYFQALELTEPVYLWMQRSDKKIGIEQILDSLDTGQEFSVTVGFYNNTKERIRTITKWLHDVVHNGFNETIVQRMRENSSNADTFIEEVCSQYEYFTHGNSIDFETVCLHRDLSIGNPSGTAYKMFSAIYNGYRDKMDTEKAIYRLSTLGIIDDYTVDFNSGTFTLKGSKKTPNAYYENLKSYLQKYYSVKTTKAKLRKLDNRANLSPIRSYLNFLVSFVYDEIQKKREIAIHDMKEACRLGLDKGSIDLKDYIDLYFNSKYARSGYSYLDSNGHEINASLADLTDNGKEESIKLVFQFIEIVDHDPKAGQIDNLKHLRGACARMLRNQPDSYTILLLSAYSLYMLECKNPRFLSEAENLLIQAFISIHEKEPAWSDQKLEEIFKTFTALLIDKNPELESFMQKYGFVFDFDTVMVSRMLQVVQKANNTLKSLNKILN